MIRPGLEEFRRLAAGHDLVPVCREVLADLETPVSAFRKLAGAGDAALLESMEGGETWGRYSIIGLRSGAPLRVARPRIVRLESDRGVEIREDDRPLRVLDSILAGMRTATLPGPAQPCRRRDRFRHLRHGAPLRAAARRGPRRPRPVPTRASRSSPRPCSSITGPTPCRWWSTRGRGTIPMPPGAPPVERIDDLCERLRTPDAAGRPPGRNGLALTLAGGAPSERPPVARRPGVRFTSTVSRERFCAAVERAREYIRAGDIVQVVLAHRLEAEVAPTRSTSTAPCG